MRRTYLQIVLLVASAAALSSFEAKATVVVSPPQPTVDDSVKVTVKSGFGTLCWEVLSTACSSLNPDTVVVSVQVQYCGGAAGCSCGQDPWSYQQTCNFALLPAGDYVARFEEVHINPSDPIQTRTQLRNFSVQESTPTRQRTWGSLKISYR